MGDAVVADEHVPTGLLVGMTVELIADSSGGRMWDGGEKGDEDANQNEVKAMEYGRSHTVMENCFE